MRPFDISKFRKDAVKAIPGISIGFNDPKTWLDTGCLALNYLVSDDFYKGIPLEGKMTMFAGEPGSGKSYIVSANLVKYAQQNDIFPVLVDTENALDASWLEKLGVDTEEGYDKITGKSNGKEPKIFICRAAKIDDISLTLNNMMNDYVEQNANTPKNERPKMLFIIDSLGMAITPTEVDQASSGDMKGDMGRKAKQLGLLAKTLLARIGSEPIGLVCTNHTYDSQDMFSPDPKISGGKLIVFASSIIVQMNKGKLKEDENGTKIKDVTGIRCMANVAKSRYAKPFERIEIKIPYDTGMDRYSGLKDLFEKMNIIKKSGSRWQYSSLISGEEKFCEFEKNITDEMWDLVIKEFTELKNTGKFKIQTDAEFLDDTDPDELNSGEVAKMLSEIETPK